MLTRRRERARLFDNLPFSQYRTEQIDEEILAHQQIDMAVTPEQWQALQVRMAQYQTDVQTLTTAITNLDTYRQQIDPASKNALNTAKSFRGLITDNWCRWLMDFKKTAQACRWNDDRKLEILPSLMIEHAEQIYNAAKDELQLNAAAIPITFDNLTELMTEKFNNPDSLKLKASSFHQCKQIVGETAETYAHRVQDLFAQAYPNIAGADRERMILDVFTEGVQTNIKLPVMLSNPADLITAVAAARKFELHNPLTPQPTLASLLSLQAPAIAALTASPSTTTALQTALTPINKTQQLTTDIQALQSNKRLEQIQDQINLLQEQLDQNATFQDMHQYNNIDDYQDYTPKPTSNQWSFEDICNICNQPIHMSCQCQQDFDFYDESLSPNFTQNFQPCHGYSQYQYYSQNSNHTSQTVDNNGLDNQHQQTSIFPPQINALIPNDQQSLQEIADQDQLDTLTEQLDAILTNYSFQYDEKHSPHSRAVRIIDSAHW